MLGPKQFQFPFTSIIWTKNIYVFTMIVRESCNCLVINIFQNIFYVLLKKRKSYRFETTSRGVNDSSIFISGWTVSLRVMLFGNLYYSYKQTLKGVIVIKNNSINPNSLLRHHGWAKSFSKFQMKKKIILGFLIIIWMDRWERFALWILEYTFL